MTLSLLDNIFWHSLSTTQAHFAEGAGKARRFAKGFSPILGFENASEPDFADIEACCDAGEQFYIGGWTGEVPSGWNLIAEARMYRMVWDSSRPAPAESTRQQTLQVPTVLNQTHAQLALALAKLTNPGPFGLRTLELGDYFGFFEGDQLIAMAGERSQAGHYREISGVCTHPDHQGKGMAKHLMHLLLRRQLQRNEIPFLHVMSHNESAHQLYLRMGFRDYCETPVRVLQRQTVAA